MISIIIISKDEPELDGTLTHVARHAKSLSEPAEVLVVDASDGRLDHIRERHQDEVQWLRFDRSPGVGVSIPHQRNAGVRMASGEIIVFTDSGCEPREGWLARLVAPLYGGENITTGLTVAAGERPGLYDQPRGGHAARYLKECATINLAFRRDVLDAVGGFDESFAYGSDVDFSWRLIDAGYRILSVPDSVVVHDWGDWRRQARRSYAYGKARARLYRKHPTRRRRVLRDDPVVVVYPLFLLGLPLTLVFPVYPLLLLIPAWRNRSLGPVRVVANHLICGGGVLAELVRG
jgi:cellulose synthase/poly-beta-1,6-N-acetylglucosamine synthase-like glycosyltransferase